MSTSTSIPFGKARARLTLGSLDNPDYTVIAQYNPKELQYDRTVTWTQQNQRDNRQAWRREMPLETETDDFQYTSSAGRTLTVELFFDGYETNESVEGLVGALEMMSTVRDPKSSDECWKRPHYCVVAWGNEMKPFRCIIQSLSVKYTAFDTNAVPLRASCTVKLQEAQLRIGRSKHPKLADAK